MTDRDQWRAVDDYLVGLFVTDDAALQMAREAGSRGDVPAIEVSPTLGAFLGLLARMTRAKRVLELGTLAGYSGVWLARGIGADGRLVTCEFDPKHADIAAATFARAGLTDRVEIRTGAAMDTLDTMIAQDEKPFDLVFIDADKHNYPDYLARVLRLSRPGTVIVADNVVRRGAIVDAGSDDPSVAGIRSYLQAAAAPGLVTTCLQTVGGKGWDGLSITVVEDPGA